MRYLIISLAVLSILSGIFYTVDRYGYNRGKSKAETLYLEQQRKVLKDEAVRLNNRPKSNDDVINRLRQWGERVRKAENNPV
jgi:hypothetical protein